jgi:hypothetical protein
MRHTQQLPYAPQARRVSNPLYQSSGQTGNNPTMYDDGMYDTFLADEIETQIQSLPLLTPDMKQNLLQEARQRGIKTPEQLQALLKEKGISIPNVSTLLSRKTDDSKTGSSTTSKTNEEVSKERLMEKAAIRGAFALGGAAVAGTGAFFLAKKSKAKVWITAAAAVAGFVGTAVGFNIAEPIDYGKLYSGDVPKETPKPALEVKK